jgi:hypothetical protein
VKQTIETRSRAFGQLVKAARQARYLVQNPDLLSYKTCQKIVSESFQSVVDFQVVAILHESPD